MRDRQQVVKLGHRETEVLTVAPPTPSGSVRFVNPLLDKRPAAKFDVNAAINTAKKKLFSNKVAVFIICKIHSFGDS